MATQTNHDTHFQVLIVQPAGHVTAGHGFSVEAFSDSDRRQLLRELAGAFQLESQKLHWTDDSTGNCPFCKEPDSRRHRLVECAAFEDVRIPFQVTLRQMEAEGFCFDEHAVIHYHPDQHFNHLLHFQQPDVQVSDDFHVFAMQRELYNNHFIFILMVAVPFRDHQQQDTVRMLVSLT